MLQFYFLSVIANFIGGALLASAYLEPKFPIFSKLEDIFNDKPNLKIILGVVALLVGIMKILSVVPGDVIIVGDLLPGLVGLLVGLCLIFDYYQAKNEEPEENHLAGVVDQYRHILGILAMVLSLLHFFLPKVLFL
ncbi:MAG: hypothetical protein LBQ61_00265 [Spirochaetales bacterium]|jgi:hypothetical protein|nr:hypothetical protein [Spirochaetales bacterium]